MSTAEKLGAMVQTLQQKALQVATTQLGQHEEPKGSNWGPRVKEYLLSVGLRSPNPWCMAFVYWCFDKAAKELGVKNPLSKTGGVLNQWQLCNAKLGVKTNPIPGDVFIMRFSGGRGHTGIVEKVENGLVYTIEGNSNDEGVREGFEVCRQKRVPSSIIAYLRTNKSTL